MSVSIKRMKELIHILNEAAREYYQKSNEIMSNLEYDALYDELEKLEKETGIILGSSPTQRVGDELLPELPKREHEMPMLSLDKTKNVEELAEFIGEQKAVLSWKMDGLTIVLTYKDGVLVQAVTRGNGTIGEEITANAKTFVNLPLRIPFAGELVLRGEAVISYSGFARINEEIGDEKARYKNPRNLCSGSVRQLSAAITKKRGVQFYAFSLVRAEGVDFQNSRAAQFDWMHEQGFDVVEYCITDRTQIAADVESFAQKIEGMDIPSDGLVLLLEDIAYGESLGTTSKFPRNAMAFKWTDELRETTLLEVEWSPSRTGLINPVAIFTPVELEGTTVSRASVHNISIVEALALGEGDILTVYKANMIIPQIAENLSRSATIKIPKNCPACGHPTSIRNEREVKTLYCSNADCPVKQIKGFALMVSRDALNIDGLSEMTLEKFLSHGFLHRRADIFHLKEYEQEILGLEGFGKRSFEKLMTAIEAARHTTMPRFIYSLGIAGIGLSGAKAISRHFHQDFFAFLEAGEQELQEIEGVGGILAKQIMEFFADAKNRREAEDLYRELKPEKEKEAEQGQAKLLHQTFVITGKLEHFSNRKELEELIEQNGGKLSSSVSAKTHYLINNDTLSSSGKNKKAKELGIPILSEEDFLEMLK